MENFSMIDFNYFDITIGAIILILGIKGFMNGFIKEAFGLIGLVGGVYFASRFAQKAATFIDINFLHLENIALLKLIGFLVVLVIVWLSATILGSIFSKLINISGLGFINRFFGFIAGAGKYLLIFALIVAALSNIALIKDNLESYSKNSVLYPYLKQIGSSIINLDPEILDTEKSSVVQTIKEIVNLNELNSSQIENNTSILNN